MTWTLSQGTSLKPVRNTRGNGWCMEARAFKIVNYSRKDGEVCVWVKWKEFKGQRAYTDTGPKAPHKQRLSSGCDPAQWLNSQLGSDLHLRLALYSVFLSGSFFPVAAAQSSLLPPHWMTSLFCLLDTLTVCLGMWGCTEQVWPECECVKGWEEEDASLLSVDTYNSISSIHKLAPIPFPIEV